MKKLILSTLMVIFCSMGVMAQTIYIWDGSNWSPAGIPGGTDYAFLNGDYSTDVFGPIFCDSLIVNSGKTLTITGGIHTFTKIRNQGQIELMSGAQVLNLEGLLNLGIFYIKSGASIGDINSNITNPGTINLDCNSTFTYNVASYSGNSPNVVQPNITTSSSLPNGTVGSPYLLDFNSSIPTSTGWSIVGGTIPPGLTLSPDGTFSGSPITPGTYNFNVSVSIPGPACNLVFNSFSVTINSSGGGSTTTWNGTSWSNGVPTPTKDAIIAANYNSAIVRDGFLCKNLTVNSGISLIIRAPYEVSVSNALTLTDANSNIDYDCNAFFYNSLNATLNGGNLKSVGSVVTTNSFPVVSTGLPFVLQLQGNLFGMEFAEGTPLPPGLSLDQATGVIFGTINSPGDYDLFIGGFVPSFPSCGVDEKTITLKVRDGLNPFLRVSDVEMTFGDAPITVAPSSFSTGAYSYSISPTNACATIDAQRGEISITCAGPTSQYVITVSQDAANGYAAGTTTANLTLRKATPFIDLLKTGYVLTQPNDRIEIFTDSDAQPQFTQLDGFDVATVQPNGNVNLLKTGTFYVLVTYGETDNFNETGDRFLFTVYETLQPPLAANDTVEIQVGEEVKIDILKNDIGYTSPISAKLTDIDVEQSGGQSKYLDPAAGSYLVDTSGILTFKPFRGALGTVTLLYTITDENGLESAPGTVTINIIQPGEQPLPKATELITPNNDGFNDAFVIGFVDITKPNQFVVYDRNGLEVFAKENYQNDWEGETKSGKLLENGVYFYLFNENKGDKEIKGMIEIRR